mmetsp:Transcript_28381/g.74913  ORF Transcript_28381/g.74913 Transcript_28381/m.74913 type:complete len:156 (+) Transcript_28381:180-647(+)
MHGDAVGWLAHTHTRRDEVSSWCAGQSLCPTASLRKHDIARGHHGRRLNGQGDLFQLGLRFVCSRVCSSNTLWLSASGEHKAGKTHKSFVLWHTPCTPTCGWQVSSGRGAWYKATTTYRRADPTLRKENRRYLRLSSRCTRINLVPNSLRMVSTR